MSPVRKKRLKILNYLTKEKIPMLLTIGIFAVAGVFSLYLIAKLYETTVINHDIYARAASEAQWKLMTYTSDRGMIYDANGNPLASNTYNYTVVCSPNIVAQSENFNRTTVIEGVSSILGIDASRLEEIIPYDANDASDPRNDVLGLDLCRNVEVETKEELQRFLDDNNISGISFVSVPQRYYNYGSLAAQVIGYATNNGVSLNGIYGLESYYNETLSGTNGFRYSEVDSRTDGVLPYTEAINESPVDGNNIVLNLDVNIQRIAEEACRSAYNQYSPRGGVTAIVMNPYTGAILAMVSLPDYDLNDPYGLPYGMDPIVWNSYTDEEQIDYLMSNVWRNRCISDTYEPGSTFKALTTAIALEEGLTNENELFSDEPIQISDWHEISCWLQKQGGYNHGEETLLQAFENSCNPIFVQLALRIEVPLYYEYVHTFGFYETTGIDLPAEGIGIFHDNPSYVDMSCLSFGESATVTPIQLLNSYCAIVNGGNLMVPHLVQYITDEDGNIVDEIEPEVIRTIFSEETCARMRAMMSAVVNDGTGSAGRVIGYDVAGKTSTSTIELGEEAGMHVLSFSCFAPASNPEIAVLVVLNRPEDRSVGSSAAAATAARIVEGTLTYMGVPRVLSEEQYEEMTIRYWVQASAGLTAAEASSTIGTNGISTIYADESMTSDSIVAYSYPGTDTQLYRTGVVILYPEGDDVEMLTSTVPNLRGKTAIECIEALRDVNLNCLIEGDLMGICVGQDEVAGSVIFAGSTVVVTLEDSTITATPTPSPDELATSEDGVAVEPEENLEEDIDEPIVYG